MNIICENISYIFFNDYSNHTYEIFIKGYNLCQFCKNNCKQEKNHPIMKRPINNIRITSNFIVKFYYEDNFKQKNYLKEIFRLNFENKNEEIKAEKFRVQITKKCLSS